MVENMRYMNVAPKNIRRRRLLMFVPVIILFVILYIIGYKTSAVRNNAEKFIDTTNSIANQSNYLGKQFRAALNSGSKSKYLSESLNSLVDQNLSLSQKAEAINPPDELKLAHSFFVVSMKLRHQGLEKYSRPLISIIEKNKAKQKNITNDALNDLSLSDIAYSYYVRETRVYLDSIDIKKTPKKSVFLPARVKQKTAKATQKNPKEKKNSLGDPDIFIDDVATDPLRVSFNPGNQIRVLPDTDSVKVRVRAGNKGKVDETDIAVEISLYNNNKFIEKKDGVIDSIKNGKTAKITLKGFSPKKEGINMFKIKVGPIISEKNISDNNYTYKFIFRSQDSSVKSSK